VLGNDDILVAWEGVAADGAVCHYDSGGSLLYTYDMGLTPGAQVFYSAGSSGVEHSFTATRSPSQFSESAPLRLAWFGDLGWQNAQALDYLVKDAAKGLYDAQIHVGGEACLGSGALYPSGLRKCVAHPSFPPLPCRLCI